VPGDVSVVGFDDIQLASYVYPSLTSVRMARSDLARGAFSVLRGYIEQPEITARAEVRIPTRLVVRESSGRVAGKPVRKAARKAGA
jgi:LacI family transcriptional regulator